MVYTKWTREQYQELSALIKKKVPQDEIVKKMKTTTKDLYYRKHLLKKQTNIMTWPEQELILLERSKNLDEYVQGCFDLLGKGRDKKVSIDHWMNRDKYLSSWFKEKDEKKKAHLIEIKTRQIPEPRRENGRQDALPDVGDQMAKLIQSVVENTAVLKDLLKVQHETYALFKGKLEAGAGKKDGAA